MRKKHTLLSVISAFLIVSGAFLLVFMLAKLCKHPVFVPMDLNDAVPLFLLYAILISVSGYIVSKLADH